MEIPQRAGPEIEPLHTFLRRVPISRTTIWRWRKRGWLPTVQIAGQPYVRKADVDEFLARAGRGEFANVSAPPKTEAA